MKMATRTPKPPKEAKTTARGDRLALSLAERWPAAATKTGRMACASLAAAATNLGKLYETADENPTRTADEAEALEIAILRARHRVNAACRAVGEGWSARHAGVSLYLMRPEDDTTSESDGLPVVC
jgi:hypothetical protein